MHQARQSEEESKAAARKTLSLLMPVGSTLTAQAVMPQGEVGLQEASAEGAFSSGGTAGFVVEGPPVDATETQKAAVIDSEGGGTNEEIIACIDDKVSQGTSSSAAQDKL